MREHDAFRRDLRDHGPFGDVRALRIAAAVDEYRALRGIGGVMCRSTVSSGSPVAAATDAKSSPGGASPQATPGPAPVLGSSVGSGASGAWVADGS